MDLKEVREAVISGRHQEVEERIRLALDAGEEPEAIVNGAMIPAMEEVGARFGRGEIFVPEMLVAAHTMKKGLEVLKPLLAGESAPKKGPVVMCTVKGDIHDIGKNLVCMMLEGAGFQVVDLGVDLSVPRLVEELRAIRPRVLGLSALLTTTMPEMDRVLRALEEEGLRGEVRVMVGGAPVDEGFARKIGADGYGRNAAEAVTLARRFVEAVAA